MVAHNSRQNGFYLFLIGLFSMTRISLGGSIAISELLLVGCMPFILMRVYGDFGRDGMKPIIILSILWFLGACLADIYYGSYLPLALKGIATPIVYFCSIVCCYALLRDDLRNVRWFVLGVAISYIVSTFVFQRATTVGDTMALEDALEATIDYKLYWIGLASQIFLLPVRGWFTSTSTLYCLGATGGLAIFALLIGARSMFLALTISWIFIFIGKVSKRDHQFIRKRFFLICIAIACATVGVKKGYESVVAKGLLSENEIKKYEMQTREGNSILQLIMAGRVEFFVCAYAACQHPVIGRGSWALDYDGLYLEFLSKYGNQDDYVRAAKVFERNPGLRRIPAHSHIMTYWMWHGIFGLLLWVYIIYIVITTMIRNMQIVQGLLGYFALSIPLFLWDVLFSPAGYRVSEAVLFVLCLLVRKKAREMDVMRRNGLAGVPA